jgi:hypothetical protein
MSSDPDATGDQPSADVSRWRRFSDSVSRTFLKPAVAAEGATGNTKSAFDDLTTVDEVQAAIKRSNDKERLVGLLISPVAAAIGFVVTSALVANDPKKYLADGQLNPHYTNPTLYTELGLLTLALALAMLGTAWFRKRTFFGIAAAFYGLSMFNLRYWGFGVPYILIGSWYLVRAYRLSEKLKRLKAEGADGYGTPASGPRPTPSKRYTPPAAPARRTPKPKPGKGIEAS